MDKLKERLAQFFERLGTLSRLQRLIICLVSFALIGAGYYFLIFSPKNKELKKVQQEYIKQKDRLAKFKKAAKELPKYEARMAEKQAEFNIAIKALPDKREVPNLLTQISKAGTDSGLDVQLFQPRKETKKDFYVEIPVAIRVKGGYHQISDFFFQVAKLNRIVNIRNISIKPSKPALGMTCQAVTYMYQETKPEPKGEKGKKGKRRKKR